MISPQVQSRSLGGDPCPKASRDEGGQVASDIGRVKVELGLKGAGELQFGRWSPSWIAGLGGLLKRFGDHGFDCTARARP